MSLTTLQANFPGERARATLPGRQRPMRALLRAVGAVCKLDDGEVTGRLEVARHA